MVRESKETTDEAHTDSELNVYREALSDDTVINIGNLKFAAWVT